jgi:hypothetical protein
MVSPLWCVVVDAADPGVLGGFWAGALGWEVLFADEDDVAVGPEDDGPGLFFVRVDDPKAGKNRVHLDLNSGSDEDYEATVARLEGLGARKVDIGQGTAVSWEVMADPEGNELCVLRPRSTYAGAGPLAAIVVDCADPAALARFWGEVTGWELHGPDQDGDWGLAPPGGVGPHLELIRVPDEDVKTVKNRLHLDVAPPPGGDQAAEVARLQALGAVPADVGQGDEATWVVLADPEGNELCVLTPRASFRERLSS